MTLRRVLAFTMIAIVGLGVQAEAQAPCPEYLRLRNAATEAWKQAMRAPRSERCGALYHASLAAEATLKYADNNRESCNISDVIVVAVGLVVALAFSNLVKAFTDNIINPLIASVQPGNIGPGLGWQLVKGGGGGTYLNLGAFINLRPAIGAH